MDRLQAAAPQKSRASPSERDAESRRAAVLPDFRPAALAQRRLIEQVNNSPAMAAQRARMTGAPAVAASGSGAVVQLRTVRELLGRRSSVAAIADAVDVRPRIPSDPATLEAVVVAMRAAVEIWRRSMDSELGEEPRVQRQNLVALLQAGDLVPRKFATISWLFGLIEQAGPPPGGVHTLAVTRDANGAPAVKGRPSLFSKGLGTRLEARRHITAWHNLRALLNQYLAAAGDPAALAGALRASAEPDIVASADLFVAAAGRPQADHNILFAGVVLNNNRANLWLGSALENISINTMATHLGNALTQYRNGQRTYGQLRAFVENYGAGAPKSRACRSALLAALPAAPAPTAAVVIDVVSTQLRELQIDRPIDAALAANPIHDRLFALVGAAAANAQEIREALAAFSGPAPGAQADSVQGLAEDEDEPFMEDAET